MQEQTVFIAKRNFEENRGTPKVIVAQEKLDCSHLLGKFVDSTHYDVLVEEDTDCYMVADCSVDERSNCDKESCSSCDLPKARDEKRIAFIFRKNFFTQKEQEGAYLGLRDAASPSQNRGLAAGPKGAKIGNREYVSELQLDILEDLLQTTPALDPDQRDNVDAIRARHAAAPAESSRGKVWLSERTQLDGFVFEEWVSDVRRIQDPQVRSEEVAKTMSRYISNTTYANTVFSGIAGWFDRYPRIPYLRPTAYTEHNLDKFKLAFPFLQTLDEAFRHYLPWRWNNQKNASKLIDQRYLVPETVFTTITVNKSFRTAAHLDAGDLDTGLSNLLVLSNNGNYKGGYLVFPEYRVAVNVRPGDLLLVNNHEIIHGNTPIELLCEEAERISLVCYFREGMLAGGQKEYEDHRRTFIEARKNNNEHPLWRENWNGISPNCFSDNSNIDQDFSKAKDWYDYLMALPQGEDWLKKYHPWLYEVNQEESGLGDMFQ